MVKAVLFDIGGTLHTVHRSDALRDAFARRLIDRLEVYGIRIGASGGELSLLLQENGEAYKRYSAETERELPAPRVWNEFYLKQFGIGEEKLAPIAEELSFLYDYERVCNKRRPNMVETIKELHGMGLKLGIISNIISTSFVPHMLNEYDIARYMSCVVMSSQAVFRKPDRRIFDIALDELDVAACESAYVGDTVSRDILGARNAGMAMAILIKHPAIDKRESQSRDSAPQPDYLIDELDEIPGIVREHK